GVIDLDDLPAEIAEHTGLLLSDQSDKHDLTALVGRPMADIERIFIEETLKSVNGNREEAARLLQIGQRTLYRKLKEWEKADEDRLAGESE
ncbi:MAG TPA: helix-turn-helix domain-containing protein, partial [Pirellulales bacterium]